MRKRPYLNAVLTVIAVLLSLNLLVVLADGRWPGAANAQQPGKGEPVLSPPFNSGEDRKALISLLEQTNSRLSSLEARLDKGLNVVVTKMPPVVVSDKKGSEERREPNSDTRIQVKKDGAGADAQK